MMNEHTVTEDVVYEAISDMADEGHEITVENVTRCLRDDGYWLDLDAHAIIKQEVLEYKSSLGFTGIAADGTFTKKTEEPTKCARCGERFSAADLDHNLAEVADGIIHAGCMRPGEEVA